MPVCTHIKSGSVCTGTDKEKALFHNMPVGWSNNPSKSRKILGLSQRVKVRLTWNADWHLESEWWIQLQQQYFIAKLSYMARLYSGYTLAVHSCFTVITRAAKLEQRNSQAYFWVHFLLKFLLNWISLFLTLSFKFHQTERDQCVSVSVYLLI